MKPRLFVPGPSAVPERVQNAMHRSLFHHRSSAFQDLLKECQRGFCWLLESKSPPLFLSCSGTGAMEAAVRYFFAPCDQVLCITGGKFGSNWLSMCQTFGLQAFEVSAPWGQAVSLAKVEAALQEHPHLKGVICVASETSTGVRQPYEAIGRLVAQRNCLFFVDGIGAAGVWDIVPERDHIDILVMSSAKGLMLPPGLGFVWASERAWQYAAGLVPLQYYFALGKERLAQEQGQTAYTPAVSLLFGLKEALTMMQEEGRRALFYRHGRLSLGLKTGIEAMGLKLFSSAPSDSVTAVCQPDTLPAGTIPDMLEQWAKLKVAEGQEKLKGKIFRIGHMGDVDELDICTFLSALELVLNKLEYNPFAMGTALKSAAPILMGD